MRCAEHQSGVRCRTGFTAGHPATEWAREEFVGYTEKIFGRVPDVAFFLPGETDDFADDFRALKDTDGYAVRTRGGKICFVADNPKGCVNGVHRWLERNSDIIWPRPAGDICFFSRASDSGLLASGLVRASTVLRHGGACGWLYRFSNADKAVSWPLTLAPRNTLDVGLVDDGELRVI